MSGEADEVGAGRGRTAHGPHRGREPRERRGFWRFWGSLPGLITAIAGLLVALTPFVALFVHQRQELSETTAALDAATSQPTPTVTVTVTATPETFGSTETASDGGSSVGPISTQAAGVVTQYLDELEPVDGHVDTDTVTVNGVVLPRSLYRGLTCSFDSGGVEFDLGRSWSSMQATVGLGDRSDDAGLVQFEVFGDGERLYNNTFALGESEEVRVDVTGVLRLTLSVVLLSETCPSDTSAVWGEAQLLK